MDDEKNAFVEIDNRIIPVSKLRSSPSELRSQDADSESSIDADESDSDAGSDYGDDDLSPVDGLIGAPVRIGSFGSSGATMRIGEGGHRMPDGEEKTDGRVAPNPNSTTTS